VCDAEGEQKPMAEQPRHRSKEVHVNLGQLGPPIDVCPRLGRSGARRRRPWEAGLPVRREWIIQVPEPIQEPPLPLPDPGPEQEPEPVPEEAPA
jgi:hypothetical protein